jgi:hypothetical protein
MFTIVDQRKQAVVTGSKSNNIDDLNSIRYLMGLQEVGGGMDWIDLAKDRKRWWALVNAVMNLNISYNAGNFLSA